MLHVNKFFFFLLSSVFFFFVFGSFICYLEPKLTRELTRKPNGSFSFLACTSLSLKLIKFCILLYKIVKINHLHLKKHNKDYFIILFFILFLFQLSQFLESLSSKLSNAGDLDGILLTGN